MKLITVKCPECEAALEKERLQNEKEKKDNIVKIIVAVVIIYLICYIIGGEVEWLARTAIIWTGIVMAIRGISKSTVHIEVIK